MKHVLRKYRNNLIRGLFVSLWRFREWDVFVYKGVCNKEIPLWGHSKALCLVLTILVMSYWNDVKFYVNPEIEYLCLWNVSHIDCVFVLYVKWHKKLYWRLPLPKFW